MVSKTKKSEPQPRNLASRFKQTRNNTDDSRLRSVIESAVDAILTIDEQGIIETVNPAVEKLFGYSPDELLGKNVKILMPSPYHKEHDGYIRNYLQTGERKIIGIGREVVARRKDGTTFPIDLAVSEFQEANRRMFTGIIRDISARKEMESNLQEREARMRSIVETAVDGIFTINERGIIHTVNPAALHIFGYSEKELIGNNVKLLMPEPDHSKHDSYLRNYLKTGKAKIIGIGREVTARRKDGSTFPIDLAVSEFCHGEERMFTGIVRDISNRKRSETRLRVEHAVTEILAEAHNLPFATSKILQIICSNLEFVLGEFFVLDDEEQILRCIEFWTPEQENRAKYESYCFSRTFRSGVGLPGKIWAHRQPIWISNVSETTELARKQDAEKLGFQCALGVPISFEEKVIGVMNLYSMEKREPDQELFHMMTSVGTQIGQFIKRMEVEEHLKTFEERNRQGEKLMVLGMLASEIAHEIGTPLNVISGRLELVADREKQNEQLQKEIAIISLQLDRINKIVHEHLNVFRKSQIEQRVELNGLLNSLVSLLRPYAERSNVEVVLSLNSDASIHGNEDQLQQVFLNLIMNAIQEMKGGGKLSIFSELVSKEGNHFAEVRIKDTGNGIPVKVMDRIFEPFFSTKTKIGGTGLGLAIVREIIKRYQGEIFVETQEKKGTTFYVRFPSD
jgi:PAS domain S-box-containing protein